jgi:ubiquinone/menaquinone biosynthesis C-methylase UbiE
MEVNWTQTRKVSFNKKRALDMDVIAKTVFAPIYPVIAQNAIAVAGISKGTCLDLGSGPGMLAMAIARELPQAEVIAFDFSEDARQMALKNIAEAGLSNRIRATAGDVHAMPFEDGFADLIVSRGSMFFWKNLKDAWREIHRVLAPGGATYIGGGFGSQALKERVVAEMLKIDPTWDCYARNKTGSEGHKKFKEMFEGLSCDDYDIIADASGFWITLRKAL